MPHGEEHSASLLVDVAGTPLPADVLPLLVSGSVDSSRNVPDMFVLRFSDEHAIVLAKAGFTIGAKVRLRVQSSGPGGPVPLLDGEVTAVEAELDADGFHTVVRGLDPSHRLFRGRRMEAYRNMTADEIATKVATRAGLKAGTCDTGGAVLEHVVQDNVNDWDFLAALADQRGAVVRVVEGALDFTRPAQASTAPEGSEGARANPLVLQKGVNLQWLRSTVTAAGQVPEVEVRGWDVQQKRAVVAVAPGATTSAALADADPAQLARSFSSPRYVQPASGLADQGQCDARAKALADRIAAGFAELEGAAHGNSAMRAGESVALRGMGSPFDGRYTLSAVRHEFTADTGYVTTFTVAGASERSLYGAVVGAGRPAPTPGLLSAVVTDIKDPLNLGRVKVKLPVHSDQYESGWARTLAPGAGGKRGTALLPEVGDEVLVGFGNGELGQPYVLGGLFNGKDTPEPDQVNVNDGKVQRRVFVSRTGMRVEHLEKPDGEELALTTNGGSQKIRLVQKPDASIEIISEGPVTLTAKKDIAVSTATGKVTVKGTDIALDGTSSISLKAPKVTVEGTATAELAGGATTTVRGGVVKIN
ncbi:VgrG-related protein [uncultured Cellulomonas sp.]|uniref:VgrG-related protein n=1 Tax=uncultured Cellulomonas sp. TaxID=189682 RepID=UPI0028E718F1|nr:VgrG-related protein [uncultured Cellulomonas sp.]